MPYLRSIHFAEHHGGVKALLRFIQLANDPDHPIDKLAKEFGLSRSQASRVRLAILHQQWVPQEGLKRCLKDLKRQEKERVQELETALDELDKEVPIFRLIAHRP